MSFPDSQSSTSYLGSQTSSRLQSRFTDEDDRVMGELLQEERTRGADLNFKQQTYVMVANVLNGRITVGGPKNFRAVQDRWLRLKRQVSSFRDILKASGFGWNAQEKRVEAEPPIWDNYLQSHNDMRTWRNRPWVNFELYDELVGNSRATGRLVIRMDGQDDGTGQQTGDMDELEVIHEVEAQENAVNESPASNDSGRSSYSLALACLQAGAAVEANLPSLGRSATPGALPARSRQMSATSDALSQLAAAITRLGEPQGSNGLAPQEALRVAVELVQGQRSFTMQEKVALLRRFTHDSNAVQTVAALHLSPGDPDLMEALLRSWLDISD